MIGADVIVLHGGGGAGGARPRLERLERGLDRSSAAGSGAAGAGERRSLLHAARACCRYANAPACRWCTTSTITAAWGRTSVVEATELAFAHLGRSGAVRPHVLAAGKGGRHPTSALMRTTSTRPTFRMSGWAAR